MKRLFFILFIFGFYSCIDFTYKQQDPQKQSNLNETNKNKIDTSSQNILNIKYLIYYDKKYIPSFVTKYLTEKYKPRRNGFGGWNIANPDEKVNLGCVIIEGENIPTRKLIALAVNKNYCVLYYLQGGGGVFADIMIIKLNDDLVIKDSVFQAENRDDFMKIVKKLSLLR